MKSFHVLGGLLASSGCRLLSNQTASEVTRYGTIRFCPPSSVMSMFLVYPAGTRLATAVEPSTLSA